MSANQKLSVNMLRAVVPLLALAPFLAAPATAQLLAPGRGSAQAILVDVAAEPLPLDPENPARRMVGELTYAGGVVLRATDANFGGISGILVQGDGRNFIAMSDRGTWFAGEFLYDRDMLSGVAALREAPMRDWRGRELTFGNNDSEGLAWTGKSAIVSFEGFHRIWRYSLPNLETPELLFEQTAIALDGFEGLSDLPNNGGIEALAVLPDGRLLAISEEARTEDGGAAAWLISEDGARMLSLPVSDDFMPTDATALANGDVLLLERRFSLLAGAAMRLRHIRGESIRPGGTMEARTLAVIEPPLSVDNMEALAAIPLEGGGYRLFIASDDNFNLLQRTLLMSFIWMPQ